MKTKRKSGAPVPLHWIWAWAAERDGREMLVARTGRGGTILPLVRFSREEAELLRTDVEQFANDEGVAVRLVPFGRGRTASIIRPEAARRARAGGGHERS